MDVQEKLEILADAAKYDVACTSSGLQRGSKAGYVGNALGAGCCHSFTPDGRCISLLKVLMTNVCVYDCAYCVNRCSNEVPRAAFTPEELADLTMAFYRRNYIEGLFLSSGVIGSPDHTTELMIRTLQLLREHHRFRGYIHAKAVPGTSPELIDRLGHLADRMSVNLELPSQTSLSLLCPQKTKQRIIAPMRQIRDNMAQDRESRGISRRSTTYLPSTRPKERGRAFVPAGQSTQMIIGATPETDFQILNLSQALYKTLQLKRVFFSAYLPVSSDERLPQNVGVQLNREHRLYQADWLLRYYKFDVSNHQRQCPEPGDGCGSESCMGGKPSGFVSGGGEHGAVGSVAACAGDRATWGPFDLASTTHNLFAGRGASKAGDRVQTSTLFHHLQREVSRKRGGVLPRCFAGAAGKPHRRRPSWRSFRQGTARSAQLVRVRGRARCHRRGG